MNAHFPQLAREGFPLLLQSLQLLKLLRVARGEGCEFGVQGRGRLGDFARGVERRRRERVFADGVKELLAGTVEFGGEGDFDGGARCGPWGRNGGEVEVVEV